MQLMAASLATLLLLAAPASGCSIALGLGGTLALSADATRLGSGESGGSAKLLTILNLNLSAATITVSPPTLAAYPPGFNAGAAVVEVAYSGGGLLSGVTQGYTHEGSQFGVPALLSVAAVLTVNNRIRTTAGFASGTYQTRTVVTCS